MKTGMKVLIGVAIVVIILLIVGSGLAGTYNGLVTQKETVLSKSGDIDVALQRRVDLIPNLVSTVQGFSKQELAVVNSVTSARAKLAEALAPTNTTATQTDKAIASDQLSSSLQTMVSFVVENYPNIKSDAVYIGLMDELAGTENRINVVRKDYNDAVKIYNTNIKSFPTNLIAGMFGFTAADYFEASPSASTVPTVTF